MMKIGIYGGTFNPVHTGHIHAAKQAADTLGLDKLIMIPDRIAPHKEIPAGSPSPEQRLQMLRIAVEGEAGIEVSDIELKREGKSFTYLTVEALREQYPDAELYLLMGTDMFLSFHTWREPYRITAQATLAVMYRGEKGEREKIDECKARMEEAGVRVTLVKNDTIPISSTQLRRLIAFRCAEDFLPAGVYAYIRENGLYDACSDWKNLPMEQLEPIVVRLLNKNRVAHVLGCRDTAVELAKRWGADVTDAARAGILHDITKALDGPLQLTLCKAYGRILSTFSRKYPKTLHALTGSLVAERLFGENEAVVSAICHHTTGKAGMNLLEKIIYVADYMEPCRNFPGVERLRELAFSDIDAALKLGLEMTLVHLANLGDEVSPESKEALEYLNNRSQERKEKIC
jgi:nicotinate-nucleotide adenylyltransferase